MPPEARGGIRGWLCMDVLKKIPHRHFIFSIPKILRRYFLYDRKLLADLSRCAWESLKIFLQEAVYEKNPIPGAVIAVQTFGDFLGFNPPLSHFGDGRLLLRQQGHVPGLSTV